MTLSLSLSIARSFPPCLDVSNPSLYLSNLLLDVRMCSHWLVLFTRTDAFLPSQSLFRHISPPVVPLIHSISQSCHTTHHMFHVTRSFSRGFKGTLFIPPSYTSSAESTLQKKPPTITSPIHTYWSFLVEICLATCGRCAGFKQYVLYSPQPQRKHCFYIKTGLYRRHFYIYSIIYFYQMCLLLLFML